MKTHRLETPGISLFESIVKTLTNYLKTQFLLVAVITLFYWIILSLLGIKYALLLSIITGLLSTIPLFGMTVAALITATIAVFDGIRFLDNFHPIFAGILILIIYFILNQLIDIFLAPYIMGKFIKVNPFLVILSILVGTWIFGIIGAVLTIPILLVVRTIFNHYSQK
jgi:predicted PurR-regulated permease PerM